jgi:CDP-diacylglycerol--glycerol-3-phosphate 3-phosphatidyltransferase
MAAALLAVQYGQVPAWYVMIAFARYLFLAGVWLRRKLGRPVYDLTPNISRRVFAGFQMGFLAIILLPVFSPPATHIAATLFGLPLLVGFTWDWLAASGVVRPSQRDRRAIQSLALRWLPVAMRLLILVLASISLAQYAQNPAIPGALGLAVNLLYGLAVLLVIFGFFPRVSTVLSLCLLGVYQMYASLNSVQIILAVAYTLILYMGSGAYSAWAPEDYLIYHRAGERELERQG